MQVLESNPRNGSPLDVTVLIKDPDKTVIGRMFRKSTGMVQDLALPSTGQYEICIMNRYGVARQFGSVSVFLSKKTPKTTFTSFTFFFLEIGMLGLMPMNEVKQH